jgi:hypothetical protein
MEPVWARARSDAAEQNAAAKRTTAQRRQVADGNDIGRGVIQIIIKYQFGGGSK